MQFPTPAAISLQIQTSFLFQGGFFIFVRVFSFLKQQPDTKQLIMVKALYRNSFHKGSGCAPLTLPHWTLKASLGQNPFSEVWQVSSTNTTQSASFKSQQHHRTKCSALIPTFPISCLEIFWTTFVFSPYKPQEKKN